jgi:hypothetical protein
MCAAQHPAPWDLRFENPPDQNGCYINKLEVPRGAVGYTPEAYLNIIEKTGLRLTRPFAKGLWSGFHEFPESGQDGMVLALA